MYLTLITPPLLGPVISSIGRTKSRRTYIKPAHFPNKPLSGKIYSNESIVQSNALEMKITYSPGWIDYFKELHENFSDSLVTFKGLFITGSLEKVQPLLSNFHMDRMAENLNRLNIPEVVCSESFSFIFKPQWFPSEGFFSYAILLLNSRFFQLFLLCGVVYLMQLVSTTLCTDKKWPVFTYLCNKINLLEQNRFSPRRNFTINFSWFFNSYSYVISLTSWLYKYLYGISYNKLYNTILSKVYDNLSHLMVKFCFNLELSKVKLMVIKTNLHVLFRFNIVLFAGANLNIIYASLTPVYILLGWLLDYISYLWMIKTGDVKFTQMFNLSFWLKRFLYAILYILWLGLGVFSTNGLYFLLLSLISSISVFNITIFVLGSIMSSISSSIWFLYGNPTILKSFNICRFVIDNAILPLALRSFNIRSFFSEYFSSIFSSSYFNCYTSFRRSALEWMSFLGMVFSTYGSWGLYTFYVFSSISIINNFLIWTASSFIFGLLLVYLEGTRPHFSNSYYGFVYLLFWTSICFSTNTLLVGYINIDNAASVLIYIIPINFVLAFIYPLPLYRYNSEVTIIYRLLDFLLFMFLTGTTLVSAGSVWYLIGTLS